ncbi:MAG: amidohydrolase family protein, partial [Candidatus Lindowbacteria bacterium]|nr:amidohydrolase family protein [Candidatus Lindowbacteria bacterium]
MTEKPFTFPIIDFHVHLFPDKLFDAIWKAFAVNYQWDVKYRIYTTQAIEFLKERGVEKIVYSNYAHKAGVAATLNSWNLELLEREPDLYCFAAFHPEDTDYIEDAARLLQHPRVLGFKLQLLVQRFCPQDERLFPLYEAVIAAGKRILMHVGTGPIGNEFVGIAHFRKLMNRYPELKVNVPHMGELEIPQFLELLAEFPGVCLDTAFAFWPVESHHYKLTPDDLLRHEDRIVYGSDFPNLIFDWETEIRALKTMNLGET